MKERLADSYNNIEVQPKKQTIGLKANGNLFCDIVFQKKELKIFLNLKSGELDDTKKIAQDVSNVGHWGCGSYELKLSEPDLLDYTLYLINQALDKNK